MSMVNASFGFNRDVQKEEKKNYSLRRGQSSFITITFHSRVHCQFAISFKFHYHHLRLVLALCWVFLVSVISCVLLSCIFKLNVCSSNEFRLILQVPVRFVKSKLDLVCCLTVTMTGFHMGITAIVFVKSQDTQMSIGHTAHMLILFMPYIVKIGVNQEFIPN